ncbi:MAG: flavodoxin-dependent (E)-4-hydroxy-3-methylbut-2-enyl-diphosphate synthase [Candidatus Gastranaerophilales bacterium]|nr:flavodoxin-dependent (E)-4-hydroxy-3-methylbut-2-enyl-diphosphate synthase [Candidatus Gastranaerophilales bacterium]
MKFIKIMKRESKKIRIGNVEIGGNAPVSVQSMCNTDTRDVQATVRQIKELSDAGCEIIRVAVPDKEAAQVLGDIKKQIKIPIIADIHFDWRLAVEAINQGIDGLRLNPGNIGKRENIEKVVKLAKEKEIPIRIGVNAGSLEKELAQEEGDLSQKLVKSALKHVKILEDLDFNLIKISLKSSDVPVMIDAYRQIADIVDYPLHLGVTEAGTLKRGLIKSSVGIGTLLSLGIGDTIRVSLTENPVEEVYAGFEILKSLNLRQKGLNLISCPTCGRCQIDLINLAKQVEEKFRNIDKPVTVAVMGCAVNGPGEAKSADIGIAGGINEGYIFKKGEIIRKVNEKNLLLAFEEEFSKLLLEYH